MLLISLLFVGSDAFAAEDISSVPAVETASVAEIDSGDTAWILASTALVLFMTIPGLALFYGGLVRAQNVLSVLMHCLVCLLYTSPSPRDATLSRMPSSA